MTLISVILPVYNAENFIRESVNSILHQTVKDFRLLIIDDGSTDNTVSELSKFKDDRIEVIQNKKNMGLIYSLNLALQLSKRSKYIARMDADDIANPNRFDEQIQFMEKNPEVGILGSAMQYFSENSANEKIAYRPTTNKKILSTFMFYNPLFHPTVLIRSSVLSNEDLYPTNFQKNEDHAFWIELSTKTTFANINKVLLNYRRHNSNVTNTYKDDITKDFQVNQDLLNIYCKKWNINLKIKQRRTLGIISYKERFKLDLSYSALDLLNDLEQILAELPKEFDEKYFRNIYCDRSIQYFLHQKKYKQLGKFLWNYKYDKYFLIEYAIKGKR